MRRNSSVRSGGRRFDCYKSQPSSPDPRHLKDRCHASAAPLLLLQNSSAIGENEVFVFPPDPRGTPKDEESRRQCHHHHNHPSKFKKRNSYPFIENSTLLR